MKTAQFSNIYQAEKEPQLYTSNIFDQHSHKHQSKIKIDRNI